MKKVFKEQITHTYISNSASEVRVEIMKDIGINSIDELHEDIQERPNLKTGFNIPDLTLLANRISFFETINGNYKRF